jgi:cytochrome c5
MNYKSIIGTIASIVAFLFLTAQVSAQGAWVVPASAKNVKNPVPATAQSIAKGKTVYETTCKSCHGDPGKNNGLPLVPKPSDPASDVYQKNTDAELFYKIVTGRGAMVSFKTTISDTDKWNVINYARSVAKTKKTSDVEVTTPETTESAPIIASTGTIKLNVSYNDEKKIVYARAYTMENGEKVPAAGVELSFFVKRYFRDLPFGNQPTITDAEGLTMAIFPEDLPGDTAGNVQLIVKVKEEQMLGKTEVSQVKAWGKVTPLVNIRDTRSLWNATWMAPLWLLISYFVVVIGVWAFILYIMMQVGNLYKIGKEPAV